MKKKKCKGAHEQAHAQNVAKKLKRKIPAQQLFHGGIQVKREKQ